MNRSRSSGLIECHLSTKRSYLNIQQKTSVLPCDPFKLDLFIPIPISFMFYILIPGIERPKKLNLLRYQQIKWGLNATKEYITQEVIFEID